MGKVFSAEIDIRWADLDAYGHVNNVAIFSYLEVSRTKLWLETGFDFLHGSIQALVARAECDYLKPILFLERVVISMEVPRMGNSSYDIHYRLHNGEDVIYATAKTVMVCFDTQLSNTVSIPDGFRMAVS